MPSATSSTLRSATVRLLLRCARLVCAGPTESPGSAAARITVPGPPLGRSQGDRSELAGAKRAERAVRGPVGRGRFRVADHMPRSFRFEPPEPRPGSLTRPRLLRALLGRWEYRVTSVVGGPGLGKTTLLAQAVAENRLAPRGEDVWIGAGQGDADGVVLACDVLAAVSGEGRDRVAGMVTGATDEAPDPARVADAVWRRAPTALCLVVDDAHWLTPGSPGATWLTALVDALPANGHILL